MGEVEGETKSRKELGEDQGGTDVWGSSCGIFSNHSIIISLFCYEVNARLYSTTKSVSQIAIVRELTRSENQMDKKDKSILWKKCDVLHI